MGWIISKLKLYYQLLGEYMSYIAASTIVIPLLIVWVIGYILTRPYIFFPLVIYILLYVFTHIKY